MTKKKKTKKRFNKYFCRCNYRVPICFFNRFRRRLTTLLNGREDPQKEREGFAAAPAARRGRHEMRYHTGRVRGKRVNSCFSVIGRQFAD